MNPVLAGDFPDPFILRTDDGYLAYATTDGFNEIQVAKSLDLVTWDHLGDALPELPGYIGGDTWAPEVAHIGERYVMYYTGRSIQSIRPTGGTAQCIAVATASSPEGPFVDDGEQPFICQEALGGSIDASPFQDRDGTWHLLWKNDGNCCGIPTRIWLQGLGPDGLSLVGQAVDLGIRQDRAWEGILIEAPSLLENDGRYHLFFSANAWDTGGYAVGYATSTELGGPYEDADENPILTSADAAAGPGGQAFVLDDQGDLWMAYHAWHVDSVGYATGGVRAMWIDEVTFEAGRPIVDGPDSGLQAPP